MTLVLGRCLSARFIDTASSNELMHFGHELTLKAFFF